MGRDEGEMERAEMGRVGGRIGRKNGTKGRGGWRRGAHLLLR
jgi:hypothetical protein